MLAAPALPLANAAHTKMCNFFQEGLQYGFPLAIIGGDYDSRMAYYDALEKVQTENNKEDFILLIAEKVLVALERYINILNPKEIRS